MMNAKNSRRKGKSQSAPLEMAQFIDAGSNKIKKRIRDLERLLSKKRDILPDTIILEKERTLEALKLELENAKLKQIAKENAKKYHMVRFFERKKALRGYKKALKLLGDTEDDSKAQKDLQEKKIDLCYVVNFPKTEKYIALYPNKDSEYEDSTGSTKTDLRREAFRDIVAKLLAEGSLPVPLEDILKGKKLNKDTTGVLLEETKTVDQTAQQNTNMEEEKDDFFE